LIYDRVDIDPSQLRENVAFFSESSRGKTKKTSKTVKKQQIPAHLAPKRPENSRLQARSVGQFATPSRSFANENALIADDPDRVQAVARFASCGATQVSRASRRCGRTPPEADCP